MRIIGLIVNLLTIKVVLTLHLVAHKNKLNWFLAQESCRTEGGHLVSPNTTGIQEMVVLLIDTIRNDTGRSEDFWIGISLDKKASGWVYEGDQGKITRNQSHWDTVIEEPNDNCTDHCVRLYGYNKKWRTVNCKEHYWYICQLQNEEPTTTNEEPPTTTSATTVTYGTSKSTTVRKDTSTEPDVRTLLPPEYFESVGRPKRSRDTDGYTSSDQRASAIGLGTMGIALVVTFVSLILSMDISYIINKSKILKKRLYKPKVVHILDTSTD